jgi:hypothetical protein
MLQLSNKYGWVALACAQNRLLQQLVRKTNLSHYFLTEAVETPSPAGVNMCALTQRGELTLGRGMTPLTRVGLGQVTAVIIQLNAVKNSSKVYDGIYAAKSQHEIRF